MTSHGSRVEPCGYPHGCMNSYGVPRCVRGCYVAVWLPIFLSLVLMTSHGSRVEPWGLLSSVVILTAVMTRHGVPRCSRGCVVAVGGRVVLNCVVIHTAVAVAAM